MIDEHQQDLAALYVVDALEAPERAAFEAELQHNAELQQLVRQLTATTAALALSVPPQTPPAALRARVLAGREATAAGSSKVIAFPGWRWVPWAVAACLALTFVGLGQLYLTRSAESDLLRDQQRLADLELRSVRQQAEAERLVAAHELDRATQQIRDLSTREGKATQELAAVSRRLDQALAELSASRSQLADATQQAAELRRKLQSQGDLARFKIAMLASLAGNSSQALAVAVWNPDQQEGVLRVEKLPAAAADKDYQLWVIDPASPEPTDAGVFTVDPQTNEARVTFRPAQHVSHAAKFAVSLERKGGVPKVQGPIVMLGE